MFSADGLKAIPTTINVPKRNAELLGFNSFAKLRNYDADASVMVKNFY